VTLRHFPIATAHGAVGRAVRTRHDAGQLLIGVEIVFPPAAVAAHPVLWADPACVQPYAEDPRSAPSGKTRADAIHHARRGAELLHDALSRDVLPPKAVETLFAMEHHVFDIGRQVRECWTAMFRCGVISVDSVAEALAAGTLPAFFDARVRELELHPPYSSRAAALQAQAGRGLCLVEWDFAILTPLARTALYGVDSDGAQETRKGTADSAPKEEADGEEPSSGPGEGHDVQRGGSGPSAFLGAGCLPS